MPLGRPWMSTGKPKFEVAIDFPCGAVLMRCVDYCGGRTQVLMNVATSPGESIGFRDGTAGPVNMLIAGDGKVGIGTTTPSDGLHVANGNVNVGGGNLLKMSTAQNAARGFLQPSEAGPNFNIATSQNGSIALRDGGPEGDVNLYVGGVLGNVGIGVADPNDHFRLRVAGRGRTPGHNALFSTDDSDTYVGIAAKGKSYYLTAREDDSFAIHKPSVGDRLRIDANGNVGINTAAPSARLDVNGNARINGGTAVNGSLVRKCESATLKNGSGRDSWCHQSH